ncbi:MAG: thiopurine S-methyltransferase [Gammaproteobacteria bacterium]|jgi:thiopurine S-methyltransferase
MEADFWRQRWVSNNIAFHEDAYHPMLLTHWTTLGIEPDATVFVPLCGKSHDMRWLRERGHRIVGVELSEIAVQAFFDEAGIDCVRESIEPFLRYSGGGYTLLCGDMFALTTTVTGPFSAVYDRASLIALPPPMRASYAGTLRTLCEPGTEGLLVTVHYPADALTPPPHDVPDDEVETLFSPWSVLRLIGTGATEVKGVAGNETAFHWRAQ